MSIHSQGAALNARRLDPGRLVLSELTVRLRLDPSVRNAATQTVMFNSSQGKQERLTAFRTTRSPTIAS